MASRKQRRRQQKLKRHEYEEVYVDEEGRELAPEEAEELVGTTQPARQSRANAKPQQRGGRGRNIQPPSLLRTAKRGLVFFPLMLAVIFLLPDREGATTLGKVINAIVLMGFFLPFSYVMDSVMWRTYQRRLAKDLEPKKR